MFFIAVKGVEKKVMNFKQCINHPTWNQFFQKKLLELW